MLNALYAPGRALRREKKFHNFSKVLQLSCTHLPVLAPQDAFELVIIHVISVCAEIVTRFHRALARNAAFSSPA